MDIYGKIEGDYPDRAKRWKKYSVAYTDITADQASVSIPSHSIVHGVKVVPSVKWDANIAAGRLNAPIYQSSTGQIRMISLGSLSRYVYACNRFTRLSR